jgi:glycosyltransferase involved in cell wall biosynthesis
VWQRHEVFCTAGVELSRDLGTPLVVSVPAPLEWEARQWGVHRPGWGGLFRRYGERPTLLAADLVACGSQLVADIVRDFGVDEDRLLVVPSGVDTELFSPDAPGDDVRRRLGLEDRFVVGWSGSFRSFHSIELAARAMADLGRDVKELTLLLVGDGPERPGIRSLCQELGVDVVFTGTVPYVDVPAYIRASDVALLLHGSSGPFHYSPLKLWEYLACGRPVVAPRVGQPAELLTDGVDALLVAPDDPIAVADAVRRLHAEPALRRSMGEEARRKAVEEASWTARVRTVDEALRDRSGAPSGRSTRPAASGG